MTDENEIDRFEDNWMARQWDRAYKKGFTDGYREGRASVVRANNPERARMVDAMVRLREQRKTWREVGEVFGMTAAGARAAAFGACVAKWSGIDDGD